ncbi:hypothetical protein EPN16_05620, partial [bacterium]
MCAKLSLGGQATKIFNAPLKHNPATHIIMLLSNHNMNNEYLPKKAIIERIIEESLDTKTLRLRLKDKSDGRLNYKPGQFLMLSLVGFGEAPFTFASCPGKDGKFEVSVRKVGALTNALHNLKEKDIVGVRGPYGNFFPIDKIKKKDVLFVAGG